MGFDTSKDTRYKRNENSDKKIPLLNDDDDSEDDEELFERSKQAARLNSSSNNKIDQVKSELDGAVNIMRSNINKVFDRGERLEDLEAKSENFEMNAFNFSSSSRKLSNKMWWQNAKTKLILGLIVIAILIVIIASIVHKTKK